MMERLGGTVVMPNTSLPHDFGSGFTKRPEMTPELGRWYAYELMVKANTPGSRDGRITAWVDGDVFAAFPNLRLRDVDTLKIDRFNLSLHAGSNTKGVTKKWYDNVVAAKGHARAVRDVSQRCEWSDGPSAVHRQCDPCTSVGGELHGGLHADVLCGSTGRLRRLVRCGDVLRLGGQAPSILDPTKSEWASACTKSGSRALPYGDVFDPQACSGPDRGVGASLPVASQPTCEGGYPGLFDMTGNVTEFDGNCDVVASKCPRRGGSFDVSSDAKCTFNLYGPLDFYAPFVGFRCCADRQN